MSIQQSTNTDKNLIVNMLRRFGGSSTDAILDPATKIFTTPAVEGLIGYRLAGKNAIVYGDPVCNESEYHKFTNDFHQFAQQEGLNVIYVGASQHFSDWAMKRVCQSMIEFGNELVYDPRIDPREKSGTQASLVRRKVRHASKEGVVVKEYRGNSSSLEAKMDRVGVVWLKSRKGPQIHISNIDLFNHREGKRWFYAEQNGDITGVVVINQLKSRKGWLLNHLMMTPDAAHGTPEILFISAMETLKKEGCDYVTVGSVPATELGEIVGLGKVMSALTRGSYQIIKRIFKLDGKSVFWDKFDPKRVKSYVLFSNNKIGIGEVYGLISTMK